MRTIFPGRARSGFPVALLTIEALDWCWDGRWERPRDLISSLPEFSSFTSAAANIEELKTKLLCEPSEARSIVEFRKESLSFCDHLNILTMKLSYSRLGLRAAR